MNFKKHFIITLAVLLILMVFLTDITISSIWIPLFVGSVFPDLDHKFDKGMHRNILFHSLAIPIFPLIWEQSLLLVLLNFTIGLHCLCDINIRKSKRIGFYTIKIVRIGRVRGFNGNWSTLWLLLQFVGGLTILTVWVWFYV